MQDLTPYQPVRVSIPLTGNIVDPNVQVSCLPRHAPFLGSLLTLSLQFSVTADYTTSRRPHTRRSLRRTMVYSVALPLAVNVQDYFRKDW